MLANLPWQELVTGLIVLIALAYVVRRWWPGRQAKGACHDTDGRGRPGGQTTSQGGCGGGGCGDCSHSTSRLGQPPAESEIRIHRSKLQ